MPLIGIRRNLIQKRPNDAMRFAFYIDGYNVYNIHLIIVAPQAEMA